MTDIKKYLTMKSKLDLDCEEYNNMFQSMEAEFARVHKRIDNIINKKNESKISSKEENQFKVVFLRESSPVLEKAINKKIGENPRFLDNFSQYGGPCNATFEIANNWNGLSFLAVKKDSNIEDLKTDDVLLYAKISVDRPQNIGSEIVLISFTKNINLTLSILSKILDIVHNIYGISVIHFSCKEGATIHKLFDMITSSQNLTDKYFKKWIGRFVGSITNGLVSQDNTTHNKLIFEIQHQQ